MTYYLVLFFIFFFSLSLFRILYRIVRTIACSSEAVSALYLVISWCLFPLDNLVKNVSPCSSVCVCVRACVRACVCLWERENTWRHNNTPIPVRITLLMFCPSSVWWICVAFCFLESTVDIQNRDHSQAPGRKDTYIYILTKTTQAWFLCPYECSRLMTLVNYSPWRASAEMNECDSYYVCAVRIELFPRKCIGCLFIYQHF